ncbi:MAG: hypothetical protein MUE53_07815 [Chitinophagales bacterium]|jgi:hypothetical protein|nr:hypothetical protein [Chitinophagales bacterium]
MKAKILVISFLYLWMTISIYHPIVFLLDIEKYEIELSYSEELLEIEIRDSNYTFDVFYMLAELKNYKVQEIDFIPQYIQRLSVPPPEGLV